MATKTSDLLLILEDGREISSSNLWGIRAIVLILLLANGPRALQATDTATLVGSIAGAVIALTLFYWILLRVFSSSTEPDE